MLTTLTFFLSYYLAGIACLMWLDSTDHLNLAAMAKAVRGAVRRTPKTADETLPAMWHVPAPSGETVELAIAARLFYLPRDGEYVGRHWAKARPDDLEELAEAFTGVIDLTHTVVGHRRTRRQPSWNGPTGSCFLPDLDEPAPVSPPYPHSLGVGRYAHLRPEELDWQAEHKKRAAALRVDLAALRAPVPTDDEWVTA